MAFSPRKIYDLLKVDNSGQSPREAKGRVQNNRITSMQTMAPLNATRSLRSLNFPVPIEPTLETKVSTLMLRGHGSAAVSHPKVIELVATHCNNSSRNSTSLTNANATFASGNGGYLRNGSFL